MKTALRLLGHGKIFVKLICHTLVFVTKRRGIVELAIEILKQDHEDTA